MSTNKIQNLNQSQPSRNTADVKKKNKKISSPKRTVTVLIPSVSRLTDDGQRRRRVYLLHNVGSTNNETACGKQQQQQRRMEDVADNLVPPSLCLPSTSTCSAAWALRVSASARFLLCNSPANSAATSFLIARLSPMIVCAV